MRNTTSSRLCSIALHALVGLFFLVLFSFILFLLVVLVVVFFFPFLVFIVVVLPFLVFIVVVLPFLFFVVVVLSFLFSVFVLFIVSIRQKAGQGLRFGLLDRPHADLIVEAHLRRTRRRGIHRLGGTRFLDGIKKVSIADL